VKEKRDVVVGKLSTGLAKIDEFLNEKVTKKMQKLKDGMLDIKSVSSEPGVLQQTFVIYEKQLYHKQAPIAKLQQVMVTAIGTFVIAFNLDYILDISTHVYLR